MQIPCTQIVQFIKTDLAKQVRQLKRKGSKPKLVTILIGESAEQESFVAIKRKVAKEIGINFEFVHLKKCPTFLEFVSLIKEKSRDPKTTGIIIQQPLPSHLHSDTVYNFIPVEKEIESHRNKSPFLPPLGLAVLTVLKFVFQKKALSSDLYPDLEKDKQFFKSLLKHKKVVLAGRGMTGGQPIGKALSLFKINYINVNRQTNNSAQYYKEADIIITAAGQKIIEPSYLKPGVILINVGLHKKNNKIRGDYYEEEISSIASYYTPTPKGTGPIDVLYLYKNLIDAASLQLKN